MTALSEATNTMYAFILSVSLNMQKCVCSYKTINRISKGMHITLLVHLIFLNLPLDPERKCQIAEKPVHQSYKQYLDISPSIFTKSSVYIISPNLVKQIHI